MRGTSESGVCADDGMCANKLPGCCMLRPGGGNKSLGTARRGPHSQRGGGSLACCRGHLFGSLRLVGLPGGGGLRREFWCTRRVQHSTLARKRSALRTFMN